VFGFQLVSLGLLGEMMNYRIRKNEYPVAERIAPASATS
jgi:hypothetical protein